MQKVKLTKLERMIKTETTVRKRAFVTGFENEIGTFGLFHCKSRMEYLMVSIIKGFGTTKRVKASYLDTISIKRSPEKDKYATSRFYEAVNKMCYGN